MLTGWSGEWNHQDTKNTKLKNSFFLLVSCSNLSVE